MKLNNDTKIFLGVGIITVLLIVVASIFLTREKKAPTLEGPSVDTKILVRDDSNIQSTSSARLTLVEFADFECPACGQVYPLTKGLLEKYKGKVNYVFRNFPLPGHKNALPAAIAAEAAGKQDKYWEMKDLLFTNQSEWAKDKNPNKIFKSYAKEINLDLKKFEASLKDKSIKAKIDRDTNDGRSVGVNSTPTFFLNGQRIQSFSDIDALIQSELN